MATRRPLVVVDGTLTELPAGDVIIGIPIPISGARDGNATNTYLDGPGGVPMDITGIILPFDSTLLAISASSKDPETWTAEIHVGLSLVTGAALSIVAARTGTLTGLSIAFSTGDELQYYVNGSNVNRPVITGWFLLG